MECPTDAEVLAFVEGATLPDARLVMDRHLDTCDACMATVVALVHASSATRHADPGAAQTLADGSPRYVLDHEIARGGMGRIVAAHDRLLDRRVALKLLRVRDPALARRFLRERLITARLQHPAIVPIYDAGMLEDGEPFFAMRMVTGQTLEQAAAAARTIEDRLRLLPSVIGIVDAVAYAHREGVIHRDLKPQNVLVGPFGEVVVLDWGIARVRDANDPEERLGDPELAAGVTSAGEVLGTLAYMAPEQAAGAEVDARADVYGLGAILYHLFAGEPPHPERAKSPTSSEPVQRIATLPEVPPELVAIIQRAMAPSVADRYATAQELAEDLKRWQAGRMVRAHEYTFPELFRRWVRKHRTKLAIAAAASAVAIVLGSLGFWRVVAERRVAEAERDRARQARDAADRQRAAAETLIDFVLGDLHHRLERVGRVDVLDSVAKAVLDYQGRTPAGDSAEDWLHRSRLASQAGDVASAVGRTADAEVAFSHALTAAESASVRGHSDATDQALCKALLGLGRARLERGAIADARGAYAACAELAKGKTANDLRDSYIVSQISEARLATDMGEIPRAQKLLDEVLPLSEQLVREVGVGTDQGTTLAGLRGDRWELAKLAGDAQAQLAEARAFATFAEQRLTADPRDVLVQRELGNARRAVATAQKTAGKYADAEAEFRAAIAIARDIVMHDPANSEWQRELANVLGELGALQSMRSEDVDALASLREADALVRRMAALEPRNSRWQDDAATAAMTLGVHLASMRRFDDARAEMTRGIAIREAVAKATGTSNPGLASDYGFLGELELKVDRIDAAKTAMRRSVELFRETLARADTPFNRQQLAVAIWQLWRVDPATDMTEAVALLDPLRDKTAGDAQLAELIATIDRAAADAARPRHPASR